MPTVHTIRSSFNGGEISPRAFGRTDIGAYRAGAKTIKNLICTPQGGLLRRPGTRYVANSLGGGTTGSWLIPFVVSTVDAYMMEFSDYKVRFYREGGALLYGNVTFQAVDVNTTANQIESVGHGFYHGQKVTFTAGDTLPTGLSSGQDYYVVLPKAVRCNSMTSATPNVITSESNHNLDVEMGPYEFWAQNSNEFNFLGKSYYINSGGFAAGTFSVTTTKGSTTGQEGGTDATNNMSLCPKPEAQLNTFRLAGDPENLQSTVVDISGTGDGTFAAADATEVVELETPWSLAEVKELKYATNAETMFFWHSDHHPMQLQRFNTNSFFLSRIPFKSGPYGSFAPAGDGVTMTATGGSAKVGDVGTVTVTTDFFRGTDMGLSVRKNYEDPEHGLIWLIGTLTATNNEWQVFGEIVPKYWDGSAAGTLMVVPGHGYAVNELIWIVEGDGALPPEFQERTPYYVKSVFDANTIELSATAGGSTITFSASVGSHHKLLSGWFHTVHWDTGSDNVNAFSDNDDWAGLWADGGELPGGLAIGRPYRIRVQTNVLFWLENRDGSQVPLTSEGWGKFQIGSGSGKDSTSSSMRVRWESYTTDTKELGGTGLGTSDHDAVELWRLGALGGYRGWPSCGTLFEQRLVMAGSNSEKNRIWGSESGNFFSFTPDQETGTDTHPGARSRTLTDASSFSYALVAEHVDRIRWLIPATTLLAGSAGPVFEISASTNREAITPANLNAEIVSRMGSSIVNPVMSDAEILYVSYYHTKILAAGFESRRDTFKPASVTSIADHVISRFNNAVQLTHQAEPWGTIWMCRADGRLYGCTFSREQELAAWHHHELGGSTATRSYGEVESVGTMPAQNDGYHQLWMVVKRRINGSDVRFVEYMESRFDIEQPQEDAYFVDAGPASYSGAATTSLGNLSHLEGETVEIWGDGASQPQQVVSGGTISCDSVEKAAVGLPYTWRWESLPFDSAIDQEKVTYQGVLKRAYDIFLTFDRTLGGTIGQTLDDQEVLEFRGPDMDMDEVVPLFTGVIELKPMLAEMDTKVQLIAEGAGAAPWHLLSIVAQLDFGER